MELGLGWLRFPPDVFWAMTLRELMAAVDGYMESHNMGHPGRKAQMYDELLELAESVPETSGSIWRDRRATQQAAKTTEN